LKVKIQQLAGSYMEKTQHGFYRQQHIVLKGNELYFSSFRNNPTPLRVIVMWPNVFVKSQ